MTKRKAWGQRTYQEMTCGPARILRGASRPKACHVRGGDAAGNVLF
jgi:hypothetical protein